MTQPYHIPASPVRTQITVKKSRFLTTVEPAPTVQQARQVIANFAASDVPAFRLKLRDRTSGQVSPVSLS